MNRLFPLILSFAGAAGSLIMALTLQIWFLAPGLLFLIIGFLTLMSQKEKSVQSVAAPTSQSHIKVSDVKDKIDKMSEFLKKVVRHNEIDLTKRLEAEPGVFVSLEDYINFLLSSLTEIITWIMERSEKLSISSAEINFHTSASQHKAEEQIQYSTEIIDLIHHFLGSFRNIVDQSQEVFSITDEANAAYIKGNQIMEDTIGSVKALENSMNHTVQYLEDLKKFTQEMGKVLRVIMDIANKTNTLSLNASIEAVRAGESGKGFKIVAREIQKFSQATTEASRQVSSNLKELNKEMEKSFHMVEDSKNNLHNVVDKTSTLKNYFKQLSSHITRSLDSTRDISNIATNELSEMQNIEQKIGTIHQTISDFKNQFGFLSGAADKISHAAEDIARMINNFQMNNFQTFARRQMSQAIDKIKDIFNKQINEGRVSESQIFDTDYQQIPGTNPPQYHTAYDQVVDAQIQEVIESLKNTLAAEAPLYDKTFLACAITDKKGYAPTHLKALSEPPTGDYEHDLAKCRNKRIFNDPVSLKAAQNKTEFLLQVYMRDDGTQNIDLSMPIRIFDRHWGCLRAGYTFIHREV